MIFDATRQQVVRARSRIFANFRITVVALKTTQPPAYALVLAGSKKILLSMTSSAGMAGL